MAVVERTNFAGWAGCRMALALLEIVLHSGKLNKYYGQSVKPWVVWAVFEIIHVLILVVFLGGGEIGVVDGGTV